MTFNSSTPETSEELSLRLLDDKFQNACEAKKNERMILAGFKDLIKYFEADFGITRDEIETVILQQNEVIGALTKRGFKYPEVLIS